MDEHGGALDYDLMTLVGATLDDVGGGGRISWAALAHFVAHLPVTSETWREMHPDDARASDWVRGAVTDSLLADIYDLLSTFRWQYESANSRRSRTRPKPYPRPWATGGTSTKTIGRDPIRVADFKDWWEGKDADRDR